MSPDWTEEPSRLSLLQRIAQLASPEACISVAAAESCTAGLLAAALTALPGASTYFVGGVVAYANSIKVRELDVPLDLLERWGAVSRQVATAMASGVRLRLGSRIGLATTGVAGPSSSEAKPAGLIFVALAAPSGLRVRRLSRDRGRPLNRLAAVDTALQLLLQELEL